MVPITSVRAAEMDTLHATDSTARHCFAMCSDKGCMKRTAPSPHAPIGEGITRRQRVHQQWETVQQWRHHKFDTWWLLPPGWRASRCRPGPTGQRQLRQGQPN
eukprot:6279713-Amphidinium_carterae.1